MRMEMYAPEKPGRTRHRRRARKIGQRSVDDVRFKPIEMIVGAKWHVRARVGPGRRLYVKGFTTKNEAKEWIVDQSAAWLRDLLLTTNCPPARLSEHNFQNGCITSTSAEAGCALGRIC